jgi:hypothetical protein
MQVVVDDATWLRTLQDVSLVRDYAIRNGKKPSVEVVTQIEGLGDLLPEERDQAMGKVMAALAALVAPVNLSTIINGDTTAYETGRVNLIRVGIVAVLVLIVATIAAIFLITEFVGSEACTTGCTTMITAVVLVYGACLGLIGAVAYELFHASGIVRSIEYGVFDPYRSAARVLLGVTFGWIFSVTVSFSSLISIFNQTTIGRETSPSDYAIILLPFLVGYSSSLITGLLNHLVDGVRTVFGMGTTPAADTVLVRPTVSPPTDQPGRTVPPLTMRRFLVGR